MPQPLQTPVTTPLNSAASAADEALFQQVRRDLFTSKLRSVIIAMSVLPVMGALVALKDGLYLRLLIAILFSGVLWYALRLIERKRLQQSTYLIIGALIASTTLALWDGNGLRGALVFCLPLPIMLAAMATSRRGTLIVTGLTIGVVLLLGLSEINGWKQFPVMHATSATVITFVTLLGLLGIWLATWSRDFMNLLQQLSGQINRLERMAHSDTLTGLPNRLALEEQFQALAESALTHHRRVAMLHLNIDQFKAINDSLGHTLGDQYLCQVSTILSELGSNVGVTGRLGADEFVIISQQAHDTEALATLANRLRERLSKPWSVSEIEVVATASIGIAVFPEDGGDFTTLMKHADVAMRQAKDSGGNTFKLYRDEMNTEMLAHLHLVSSLRSALANGELHLHYQPQIDIASGTMVGAEALIRWQHPQLGMIPPVKFIPAAERSGLIIEIGEWVLNEACRQLRAWEAAGMSDVVLAVNLSPVQFRRDNIEQVVHNTIEVHGVNPASLELEITESLLMGEHENFAQILKRLGALGLKFAIDDFGTGYSNLAYLRQFAVDRLKIDRSFVHNVATDAHNRALVKAITEIGKSLSLEIVAEGVEDQAALDSLRELGCHIGQGWHWAKAMPPDELLAYWQAHH